MLAGRLVVVTGIVLVFLILLFGIWQLVSIAGVRQDQQEALRQGDDLVSSLGEQETRLTELNSRLSQVEAAINGLEPLTAEKAQELFLQLQDIRGIVEELSGLRGLIGFPEAFEARLQKLETDISGQLGQVPEKLQEELEVLRRELGELQGKVEEALATPMPTPTPQPTSTTTRKPPWTATPTATPTSKKPTPTPTPAAPRTRPELAFRFSVTLSEDKEQALLMMDGIADWWSHPQCPGDRDPVESQEQKQTCLAPWNEVDDWLEEMFPSSNLPPEASASYIKFFAEGGSWGVYEETFLAYKWNWPFPSGIPGPEPLALVDLTYPDSNGNLAIVTIHYRDTSSWPRPQCPVGAAPKASLEALCVSSQSKVLEWLLWWVPGITELPKAGTYAIFPSVALLE